MEKRKSRVVPMLNIHPIDKVTAEMLLGVEQVRELILTETPKAIIEALDKNKNTATLFQIGPTVYYSEISKTEWKKALDVCIEHNKVKEDYNYCAELVKLKESF